jgi:hypothetical protein
MPTGAIRSWPALRAGHRAKEVRFMIPSLMNHHGQSPEPLLPLSASSIWGPETMIARPYCRSVRPVLAIFLTFFLFLPIYNQTRLREDVMRYKQVVAEKLQRFVASRVHNNTLWRPESERMVHREWDFGEDPCRRFPGTEGVLLVMKTGATEAVQKLPTQLLAALQCLPDFLLFSDMVTCQRSLGSASSMVLTPVLGAANRTASRLRRPRGGGR